MGNVGFIYIPIYSCLVIIKIDVTFFCKGQDILPRIFLVRFIHISFFEQFALLIIFFPNATMKILKIIFARFFEIAIQEIIAILSKQTFFSPFCFKVSVIIFTYINYIPHRIRIFTITGRIHKLLIRIFSFFFFPIFKDSFVGICRIKLF